MKTMTFANCFPCDGMISKADHIIQGYGMKGNILSYTFSVVEMYVKFIRTL